MTDLDSWEVGRSLKLMAEAADLELGSVDHQLYRPYCRLPTCVTIVGTERGLFRALGSIEYK